MKFQVGDKVTVLHSNEEGEVEEIINDKMVLVQVRGVKFPAYIDQLDFPYFRRFTAHFAKEKEKSQPAAKKYIDYIPVDKSKKYSGPTDGVWLTFLPVSDSDEFGDEVVDSLKIHLVNHTAEHYQFTYKLAYQGKGDFELTNDLPAGKDFYLHDIPFENLNDSPSFDVDFRLVTPKKEKADHYERSLKLKPKQVFMRIEEIRKKGEATFSYNLFEEYPAPLLEDKPDFHGLQQGGAKVYDASAARRHLEPAKYEVDLHIEKLVKEWQNLSNFEILTIQLRHFEKFLDLAIAHHQHKLFVIHGVGKGKLKDEIHELLKSRREVKSFINQFDPRYGYGATEIFL